jgi:hypothetical protein
VTGCDSTDSVTGRDEEKKKKKKKKRREKSASASARRRWLSVAEADFEEVSLKFTEIAYQVPVAWLCSI